MKNNYDVIVVGGGPSGSMSAIDIAKAGYSVCILEKDRDIDPTTGVFEDPPLTYAKMGEDPTEYATTLNEINTKGT